MAQGKDQKKPLCTTEELKDVRFMKVELQIDDLKGGKMKAKNGEVNVKFSNLGFIMDATVKSGGNQTEWHYKVKRLPSEIISDKSSWKIESGRIVLLLHKKENTSWAPSLRRGLEQESSSDDENSS